MICTIYTATRVPGSRLPGNENVARLVWDSEHKKTTRFNAEGQRLPGDAIHFETVDDFLQWVNIHCHFWRVWDEDLDMDEGL